MVFLRVQEKTHDSGKPNHTLFRIVNSKYILDIKNEKGGSIISLVPEEQKTSVKTTAYTEEKRSTVRRLDIHVMETVGQLGEMLGAISASPVPSSPDM